MSPLLQSQQQSTTMLKVQGCIEMSDPCGVSISVSKPTLLPQEERGAPAASIKRPAYSNACVSVWRTNTHNEAVGVHTGSQRQQQQGRNVLEHVDLACARLCAASSKREV
jgi:hypothetical protein